jgi:septal ring factor EnvC (AmiA/AmiB activator)
VIYRVAPLLLVCVAPFSVAAMQAVGATPTQDTARRVEAVQNESARQAQALQQLERRLQVLERQDKQSSQALKDKDRAIEALQRQLRQAAPSAPRSVASSQGT